MSFRLGNNMRGNKYWKRGREESVGRVDGGGDVGACVRREFKGEAERVTGDGAGDIWGKGGEGEVDDETRGVEGWERGRRMWRPCGHL